MFCWQWIKHNGFWEIALVGLSSEGKPMGLTLTACQKYFFPTDLSDLEFGPVIPDHKD